MSSGLPMGPQTLAAPLDATPTASLLTSSPQDTRSIPSDFGTILVLAWDCDVQSFKSKGETRIEAEGEIRAGWKRLVETLDGCEGLKYTVRQPPPPPEDNRRSVGAGEKSMQGLKNRQAPNELYFLLTITPQALHRLIAKERAQDFIHSIPRPSPSPINAGTLPSSRTEYAQGEIPVGDQIRVFDSLLRAAPIQGGLGITPGEGEWRRVKSIMALHDEKSNREWIQSWLGGHWYVGLTASFGQDDNERIRETFGPDLALYFSFLAFYTRALIPMAVVGIIFFLGSKGVWATIADWVGLGRLSHTGGPRFEGYGWDWSIWYGAIISIWSVVVVEIWRIKERKLSVFFGTHRASRYEQFRPQYITSLLDPNNKNRSSHLSKLHLSNPSAALTTGKESDIMAREVKMLASIPVIALCGAGLGCLLSGIFVFEAFLARLYDGWYGQQILELLPTLLFIGVIPTILTLYHTLSLKLCDWENHPTKRSYENSLTIKTFAMNAIVAYLGLFLSAYVYVPFGEVLMGYFSNKLASSQKRIPIANAAKTGLAQQESLAKRTMTKNTRLVNQLFAYTVTNQAVNTFQEIGMPYVMRKYKDWRNSSGGANSSSTSTEGKTRKQTIPIEVSLDDNSRPEETRFLRKVQRELDLPVYSLFVDYAEMVTQFGYVAIWSSIWPLAPLFALINNYIELRSDAIKICSHARRPIGQRVESIGPWLNTMSFLSWMAFITNTTLIYLFKPALDNPATDQTINPDLVKPSYTTYGSTLLYNALQNASSSSLSSSVSSLNSTVSGTSPAAAAGVAWTSSVPHWIAHSEMLKTVLPILLPTLFLALFASHAWIIVRSSIRFFTERWMWQMSDEALGLEASEHVARQRFLKERERLGESDQEVIKTSLGVHEQDQAFWRGNTEEAWGLVLSILKSE